MSFEQSDAERAFLLARRNRDRRAPYVAHSDTSREAARSIEPKLTELQRRVLDAVGDGATDEDLMTRTGLPPNTVRPRRVELVKAGVVRDSGERRKGRSGRRAAVWEVVRAEVQGALL